MRRDPAFLTRVLWEGDCGAGKTAPRGGQAFASMRVKDAAATAAIFEREGIMKRMRCQRRMSRDIIDTSDVVTYIHLTSA